MAHAGGPYTGDEGSAISLAGSATDVAANDVISYKWTANTSGLDAGATCTFDDDTDASAKITCTDDGTVQLTLKATIDPATGGKVEMNNGSAPPAAAPTTTAAPATAPKATSTTTTG